MSFGYSVGDFAALEQLAWKIYRACKDDAPEGFNDISQEVLYLHTVLRGIEEKYSGALFSATQQSRLENIRNGCGAVLENLQATLDKHKSLGKKSKRTWDRLGWGSNEIAELQSRLNSYTSLMIAFVNPCHVIIQEKLDKDLQDIQDGQPEGSMGSTGTINSLSTDTRPEEWPAIRKELEDSGVSDAVFDANKDFIVKWFRTSMSSGVFGEQTTEDKASSVLWKDDSSGSSEDPGYGTVLSRPLEDVGHDTMSKSTSQLQALRTPLEEKVQRRRFPRVVPILFKAVMGENEIMVRRLLERGANINLKDDYDGSTPLHCAVYYNSDTLVKLLLRQGADITAKNNLGYTALHWATISGHETVVQLLLEFKADIDEKDKDGYSALHWATRSGHERVIQLLLKHGAKIHAKSSYGYTALHRAAISGHETLVQLLLNSGADINEKDRDGHMALHWAAISGHETVVQVLLKYGANINERSLGGVTALRLAIFNEKHEVAGVLMNAGGSV